MVRPMRALLDPAAGSRATAHYEVSPGHARFEKRARFLGEVTGSWFDIGRQVGQQAGDLVRWVSDVWWKEHSDRYGRQDTLEALALYEAQVAALDEGLIRFMEGVAEGAGEELDRSPFARDGTHYQKVLNTNIYDAWSYRHPTATPWNDIAPDDMTTGDRTTGCSAFVSLPGANAADATIATHNRHCPFNPKCYQLAYVGRPEGGHAYWAITPGGAGAGCQIVNERGVSIILNAGGDRHREMNGDAFGVPWFLLFLHVAAHADTAAQAIELLTVGTPQYRRNAKRDSLLRTGTWNFLVSDRHEAAVIETSCDRYAVRRPGDLGESGDYLVMTNHCTLDHSYDAHNERTDLPMTAFGNVDSHPGSAARFDLLMRDLAQVGGELDAPMAQELMCGHHRYDEQGCRVESPPGNEGFQFGGDVTCPHKGEPPLAAAGGSADAKVVLSGADGVEANWTLGRPCEWDGPWDRVEF
jgi:hypothetical protein